jgi:hypothetical protein
MSLTYPKYNLANTSNTCQVKWSYWRVYLNSVKKKHIIICCNWKMNTHKILTFIWYWKVPELGRSWPIFGKWNVLQLWQNAEHVIVLWPDALLQMQQCVFCCCKWCQQTMTNLPCYVSCCCQIWTHFREHITCVLIILSITRWTQSLYIWHISTATHQRCYH